MSYRSIDTLQSELRKSVFNYTKDSKKAAGRALGTLVEIITYYLLDSWGMTENIAIETPLCEFSNPEIAHNVEFTLHPVVRRDRISCNSGMLPLTPTKLLALIPPKVGCQKDSNPFIQRNGIVKNACRICHSKQLMTIATLEEEQSNGELSIQLTDLLPNPYAMFECKRVGVEEGMRKGPQTIEKAKQGAYVARVVSVLQRIRNRDGKLMGFLENGQNAPLYEEYYGLLRKIIDGPAASRLLRNFVLTIGIISNHGNWFTKDNMNKELKVLAQSYDWLLFLSDAGLAQFIEDCLFSPSKYPCTNAAFLNSYPPKDKNRFTKTTIDIKAHFELKKYFLTNQNEIMSWFNLISPTSLKISDLRAQLDALKGKNWEEIYK